MYNKDNIAHSTPTEVFMNHVTDNVNVDKFRKKVHRIYL